MTDAISYDIMFKKFRRGGILAKDLNYSALLDYYGAMLTDKQKDVLTLYYNEDLSLSEISEIMSISRQGVMDNIRRGEEKLNQLEQGLALSKLYSDISSVSIKLEQIISTVDDDDLRNQLEDILNKLQ